MRDARIGEAEAKQVSTIEEAKAEMQRMEAQLANQTEIARDGAGGTNAVLCERVDLVFVDWVTLWRDSYEGPSINEVRHLRGSWKLGRSTGGCVDFIVQISSKSGEGGREVKKL